MNISPLAYAAFVLDFLFPPREMSKKIGRITQEELFSPNRYAFVEIYPEMFSICKYRDAMIKSLVSGVKFRGDERCAEIIGACMARHIDLILEKIHKNTSTSPHSQRPKITLIPIPSTHSRKRSRGWNQCELISKNIAKWSGFSPSSENNFLTRTETTTFQKKLSRSDRFRAQKGSFGVQLSHPLHDSLDFDNHWIIVIDDVVTTGATLREALRIIRSHGAQNVIGMAFAH